MVSSPAYRSPRTGTAAAYRNKGRVTRRPQHKFNLLFRPYQLQPMMIAPVLPGESLKSLLCQAQIWSDPLAAGTMRNMGWWFEKFYFYVRHRDLMGYEVAEDGLGKDLIDMFVNNESIASHQDADGNAWTYCPPNGVDFLLSSCQRIVEEFFRDEGEAWNAATLDGVPVVRIHGRGQSDPFEHLTLASDYEDRRVDLDVEGDGNITVDEIERAYIEWAAARDAGLMDMDYEDWMRTYGSQSTLPNVDRETHHKPELMMHHREWSYPTNTVEPTTGVPATAVGWRVATRSSKAFMFQEPGWIVGLVCCRPKVYLGNQQGNLASMMQTRDSWLPAILNNQLDVSHLLITKDTGPLKTISGAGGADEDYWVDLRDLLNNGDQFINYALSLPGPGLVSLPDATAPTARYPRETDVDALFAGESNKFYADGVVSLGILGRQNVRSENLVLGRA